MPSTFTFSISLIVPEKTTKMNEKARAVGIAAESENFTKEGIFDFLPVARNSGTNLSIANVKPSVETPPRLYRCLQVWRNSHTLKGVTAYRQKSRTPKTLTAKQTRCRIDKQNSSSPFSQYSHREAGRDYKNPIEGPKLSVNNEKLRAYLKNTPC